MLQDIAEESALRDLHWTSCSAGAERLSDCASHITMQPVQTSSLAHDCELPTLAFPRQSCHSWHAAPMITPPAWYLRGTAFSAFFPSLQLDSPFTMLSVQANTAFQGSTTGCHSLPHL